MRADLNLKRSENIMIVLKLAMHALHPSCMESFQNVTQLLRAFHERRCRACTKMSIRLEHAYGPFARNMDSGFLPYGNVDVYVFGSA